MAQVLTRRRFLVGILLSPGLGSLSCSRFSSQSNPGVSAPPRLFFWSEGKTALINADGTGLRYLNLEAPKQATWQPGPFFPDGRRVIFLSMEPRRDGPGRPFSQYYTQTPTHLWIYDLEHGTLTEIANKDRLAVFYTPQLLLANGRLLVQVVRQQTGQIFNMNLDGTDAREFTRAGEGMPYGFSLSPDSRRVAFHLASPHGYQVWTSDTEGAHRILVAAHPDHLYFGPSWSPDGEWLIYQDCQYKDDPGHDWSDLCRSRPDGSEQRLLTHGRALWFAATYGPHQKHGGGSNLPTWTPQGEILFPQRLPGSKVPWQFQPQRVDTDHFNRDFKPEFARGGTEICRLDPKLGTLTRLTHSDPPMWDFRATPSPDGGKIAFLRAETGGLPSLWVMDASGHHQRRLTAGLNDQGAEQPHWLPLHTGSR